MESNVKYKEDEGRHGFMGDNDADTYTTWPGPALREGQPVRPPGAHEP